jgi:hypothetical protein
VRPLLAAATAVSILGAAHTAGAAAPTRYVLWSTTVAGVSGVPPVALPADLPAETALGAPADLLDRTARGRLAVAARGDVVLEDIDGSNRVVIPLAGVYDGEFSPDGSKLVLASLGREVSVVDSDGAHLHLVASDAGAARWAGNTRLAYVGDAPADNSIGTLELVDPGGGSKRTLGRSFALVAPSPSPDRRRLVDQCRAQLICVRTIATPVRTVARFTGALTAPAVWSPSGEAVGMTRAGNYTSTTSIGNVRTGTVTPISSPVNVGTDDSVIGWSPDSRTILVQRRCERGQFVPSPCRDQVFENAVRRPNRRRVSHDDLKWEAVRWTKAGLTCITPPAG